MKRIQCRFSSGQRVPLLVQAGHVAPLPIVIPFIYGQLKLGAALTTQLRHICVRSSACDPGFLHLCQTRGLDSDEAILACHFESILAFLDRYAIWFQSGGQADNLVGAIGIADTATFPQIDSRTRDQYLRLLKQYLSWCVTRCIPRASAAWGRFDS